MSPARRDYIAFLGRQCEAALAARQFAYARALARIALDVAQGFSLHKAGGE